MKRGEQRLRRLEALVPVGCETCRTWGGVVYEIGDRGPERDERCPGCGRYVEIRLLRRIMLVSSPAADV